MITALVITGVLCLLVGWAFYWLNLNTPIQTFAPAVFLPVGAAALLVALGGWLFG